jgi:predicted Zn-dependent peptidase
MRALHLTLLASALTACAAAPPPEPARPAPEAPAPAPAPMPTVVLGAEGADGEERYHPPAIEPPRAWSVPRDEEIRHPSGITARIVERHELPMIEGFVVIARRDASPALDLWLCGLTPYAAPSGGRPLRREAQLLGASVSATCDRDSYFIGVEALASRMEPLLAAVAATLTRGEAPEAKLADMVKSRSPDKRKDSPRERLWHHVDTTLSPAGDKLRPALFGEGLHKVTQKDVTAARGKVTPEGIQIMLAGDITAASARAMLDRFAAAWPARAGKPKAAAPAPGKPVHGVFLVDDPGDKTEVALVYPIPPSTSPETPHVIALQAVLARRWRGAEGREETTVSLGRVPGLDRISIAARVPAGKAAATVREMLALVEKTGGEDEATAEARVSLPAWFGGLFQSNAQLAQRLAYRAPLGMRREDDERIRSGLDTWRAADLDALAKKLFMRERASVIAVGSALHEKDELEKLGFGKAKITAPEDKAQAKKGGAK